MSRRKSRWRPITAIAIAIAVGGGAGATRAGAAAADAAAVRAACLKTYFEGITPGIADAEIGAAGVPALLALLRDPSFPRRDNVVAFLSHLGGPETTTALLAILSSPPADLAAPEEDRAMLLSPQALGHIAARGDRAALAALVAMATDGTGAAGAAARAGDPARYRADLQSMALRGLALSGQPSARARIAGIAGGAGMAGTSEALRRDARQSLELFDEQAAASGGTPPGEAAVEAASTPPGDTSVLDSNARTNETPLTFANHPNTTSAMTTTRLDSVLELASLRMGRADVPTDVACCVTLARSGSAASFGSSGDGLDSIDSSGELNTVLASTAARFKVVRLINYCGGAGTNIIGCAETPGNSIAVVRNSSEGVEAVLWAHEYGHNVGLTHTANSADIMYGVDSGSNSRLSQSECNSYQGPPPATAISLTDVGACADTDSDSVHDVVDNCPTTSNTSQTDVDANGVGDDCQCGGTFCGCGNGIVEGDEECDDGNTANTDGCTTGCTICGNGVTTSPEACDDGNLVAGDGCASDCSLECPAAPPGGCRQAGTSLLTMKDPANPASQIIDWKWTRGEATTFADLGDPKDDSADDWLACAWSNGTLVMTAEIPAADSCNGTACWKEKTTGFIYTDKQATPDGVLKLTLQSGIATRAKVLLKLKGSSIPMPSLGALAGPLTLQLRGPTCFESVFAAPFRTQTSEKLVAKTVQ